MPPGLSQPDHDRGPLWLVLAGLAVAAVALTVALLAGGSSGPSAPAAAAPASPPPLAATAPPVPAPAARPVAAIAQAPAPVARRRTLDERRFARNDGRPVRADWVASFYPIYERAAKTYGVNWLLLASVHKQETGFSTHPTTYHGLNFANCCAGPMQFNVTNGPVSTWERFRDAHRRGERPASYNHRTGRHPSPYDDFDAIMAAAALLRSSGASPALDGGAWRAAYDYYGHDLTGIDYASQVVARAIGWGRRRFCINCEVDRSLVAAVDAAWGAPVRAQTLAVEEAARERREREERRRAKAQSAARR